MRASEVWEQGVKGWEARLFTFAFLFLLNLEDKSHFSFKFKLSTSVDIFLIESSISEQKKLVAVRGGRSQHFEETEYHPLHFVEAREVVRTGLAFKLVLETFQDIGHEVCDGKGQRGCQFLMFLVLGGESGGDVQKDVVSEMKHSFDLVEVPCQRYSNLTSYLKRGYQIHGPVTYHGWRSEWRASSTSGFEQWSGTIVFGVWSPNPDRIGATG